MNDQATVLEQVHKHWRAMADGDETRAHEVYAEDAVLEFPQSGERFEGLTTFRTWRRQYPAKVSYELRRITTRDDLAVVECSVSYNDGPWQFGVQLLDFRNGMVVRERIYVMEGWDAPDWRAEWRAAKPADST